MSPRTYNYDVKILLQVIQYTGKFGDASKNFLKIMIENIKIIIKSKKILNHFPLKNFIRNKRCTLFYFLSLLHT